MNTEERIIKALSTVEDPDLKKDLVSLNMISDVKAVGSKVSFRVTLTTPACPMKEKIKQDCINAVKLELGDSVDIAITMDADITSLRGKENILPSVKNIIAVASGKGGVGKSTVAVNLALGLAARGAKVGIMDADIYGPSIPIMMNLKNEKPSMTIIDGKNCMLPILQYGIYSLSIGFLIDEKQAVVWRGPMASSALKQFISDCWWGDLDYLVIDLPPGTGDIHLTLIQALPLTGAVIVTTPQDVALADAKKALGLFTMSQVNVPILGVVENMAFFTPKELPDNKYYIFGKGGGETLAKDYNTTLLGLVPLVQGIREGGDEGLPAIIGNDEISKTAFQNIADNVAQAVAIRNATFTKSNQEPQLS